MQSTASRSAAYSSQNYNYSAEASNFNYQSSSRQEQTFQQSSQNSNQRSSQAASYSRESNQLQAASQSLSRNQSSQAASDRQAALSGASAEANGGQEDSGDFFATYGTKKERRTVRKEAQVDDSAERNEEGEQGQKRSDSQEASVLRLDAQGRNEEGQQSLQRSGAKDAAAKSLAGAKNAQEAAKNRKEKSERKKARQARKEKANEAERKKDKKQRAKGSERAQSRERDSQNSQVPPPLPPKPSPKKKQNARLDAIERQLPELQNLLRTLQQDKSSSHGSESSASNVQPPEPARDAHKTQSTATEPVTFSKPAVPHANANVGTDENLFEHRSQSTETADFPSGLLGSVVASSESPSKRKTSQEAKSPPSKVWQPDPVLSDGSEIDENMTPSSQAPVHAPPASNHKPESNESDPVVDEELQPNPQHDVQAPHGGRNDPSDSDSSSPEIDEVFTPSTDKDVHAPKASKGSTGSEESDPEIDEGFPPNTHKDVEAPKSNEDPTDSEESDPEIEGFPPNTHKDVEAPNANEDPTDSEDSDPEIEDDLTPTGNTTVHAPPSKTDEPNDPDNSDGSSDSSPEQNEDLTPKSQPNVQAPRYKDFSQHVFSDRDSVLEEFISPEHLPVVCEPTEKSEKPEKVPISEVDIPAPLDDPQVNQPKKEKREPVIETVDKSVSRLVELEPDFSWMFGDKCEQTDAILNPLVDSVFSTQPIDTPEHIDACTDVQNDLPIDEDNRSALCPEKSKKEGDTTVNTTEIYKTSTEHSKVSEKSRSEMTRELMDISKKEQYLSEIARLKSVVSELESRTFVQETVRIRESQPSSAPVHRRTVGLMVKPPCRDVAINIFIEEAKPAQRSVGVNVSFEDGRKQTRTAVKSVPNAEPPKDRELVSRSAESNEYQRNNFSSNSTSISTVSSQRLMFFQSLRQSYGISAAEMVNIITELLKRDVKSVGLQVCMDASPEPPGISSDVDELNREHGILKASDHFIDPKDTTSMRTYSSGSRFDSSVVKRRYETDYTTNSTSDSLERSTFDGDGDRLSSPDSGSSIKDSAQLSSITARTDSGWQGQEESSNQEFQFTSDDGTVMTSRTIASRQILSRQVPPHSTFSNSSSGAHTSAFQQQVSSVFPSGTQGYETPQPIEEDSRLDGMALDSGNRVQNSMLQSQSSFSQSAQQTNSTTVSSVAQSKSVQQVNRTAVSSMTQSVEHNSSTAMSSMTQSRHQFGQQQLQLLELLKTNASAF